MTELQNCITRLFDQRADKERLQTTTGFQSFFSSFSFSFLKMPLLNSIVKP
jgi:hypothetical protein